MKIDWYTKFVLTVIALALLGIAARPALEPMVVKASGGYDDMTDISRGIDRIARSVERIENYGLKTKSSFNAEESAEQAVPARY